MPPKSVEQLLAQLAERDKHIEELERERDEYRENANTGAAVSRRFVNRAESAESTVHGMDKAFSVEQKVAIDLEARAEKAELALAEMREALERIAEGSDYTWGNIARLALRSEDTSDES